MKKSVSTLFAILLTVCCVIAATTGCTPAATNAGAPATQAPTAQPTIEATAAPATPAPTASPAAREQPASSPAEFDYKAESIGEARLGMTESEVLAKLGKPDSETDAEVWGADGMKHSDWSYKAKGLTLNMTETSNPESEFVVYSIEAEAPCDLPTQKGVKIGDKKDTVLAAYAGAVDSASTTDEKVVVGSLFGGVVFTLKDGLVSAIFIGASAE